jgi:hypothetical protein
MTTHLVIGDPHAKHGVSNERFDWLGKFIMDLRPDVIVNIGDHYDMESLSSYDVGKKSFEGRRYKLDLEAGLDALDRINRPMAEFNRKARKNKEKQYLPRMIMCGGNHDHGRQARAIEGNAILDGTIGPSDFQFEYHGWEYAPFQQPITVDGVTYCHFFTSGVMGRPIGGERPATMMINKLHTTCLQGHSHLFDFACRTRPDGSRIWGGHVGCFFQHEESYAGPANKMWWRGLVVLRNVENGDFDLETVSMKELRRRYA